MQVMCLKISETAELMDVRTRLQSVAFSMFLSQEAALQMMVFITFSGFKASSVQLLSKTVLSKSYYRDINPVTVSAFGSFGKKYVVTEVPTIMVEPFLREYLGVDSVIGSELEVLASGYCTGLFTFRGLLSTGSRRLEALKEFTSASPDAGFGNEISDLPVMSWCKEAYTVVKAAPAAGPRLQFLKPLIFHDGRLAVLPTPAMTLTIFLWVPFGVLLVCLRIAVSHLPYRCRYPLSALVGVRVRIRGRCPPPSSPEKTLFVCSHKTLLDPLVLSSILKRRITAVTFSLSRLSEIMSSIKTVRLSRDRNRDKVTLRRLLATEDVVICPEGTTCREPFLLRFSPLFAEVSDKIVPVFMSVRTPLFYATSCGGWKWLDPVFFCMNPRPSYEVEFLEQLPEEETCGGGAKSSIEVANYIQQQLAKVSGFYSTGLTRKDKYRFLLGGN